MAVRREDPNEPDYAPSPLAEAVQGLLEDADVDEATYDAIALVVEAAESQLAGERPLHNPRLAAALQNLRARSSASVALRARQTIREMAGVLSDASVAIRYLAQANPERFGLKPPRTDIQHAIEIAISDAMAIVPDIAGTVRTQVYEGDANHGR